MFNISDKTSIKSSKIKMLMAILSIYSTSGNKNCRDFKMSAILKMSKCLTLLQLTSEMKRSTQSCQPENIFFMVTTSSMTSQGDVKFTLNIHVYERLVAGASCTLNILLINANILIAFLGYTCMKHISISKTFKIAGQSSTSCGYYVTLALKRP